jgi:glycosyltransferase involved in cell wall biosynthesis
MPAGDQVHVLHVVPGLLPGGMELMMAQVIRGLPDLEFRHTIACLRGHAQIAPRLPPQTAIHCLRSRPNEPQLPARIAAIIRKVRPDVIHARNWGAWPDTAVGRLMVWRPPPLVFSFHGLGRAGYMPLRRRIASRILARMTTSLFTVAEASRRVLVEHFGLPARRVAIIPNGVDTARFAPGPPRPGGGRFIVGTVGNLRAVKNHALLLRACAALRAGGVDLEVRIAGEGEERPCLETLARELGLTDRCRLAGLVSDVPAFLRGLDLFVLSSDSEQHPNALIEAMASGLPCASTRVGSVEEILEGGRAGLIVSPGDRPALTAAIRSLAQDAPRRRELAQKARRRACEGYGLERMVRSYADLYNGLAGRYRARVGRAVPAAGAGPRPPAESKTS